MFKLFGLLLAAILLTLSLLGLPLAPVLAANGDILLTKTASTDNATLGDSITYTYAISNNSTDNITDLLLVDDPLGDINIPAELAAGENVTAVKSYTVILDDYAGGATELVNIATLTGSYIASSENFTAEATESVTLDAYAATLQVTKTAGVEKAGLNEVITYTYKVDNNGDVAISALSLMDDKLGAIALSDNVTSLDPGQSASAAATYTVTFADVLKGTIVNTATVSGEDPHGSAVTASSDEVVVLTNALAELFKAQILKARGVPGKGIDTAPGLQKPFNPNSRAIDNAGVKKGKGNLEANHNLELNQGVPQNKEKNREQELNGNTLQIQQGQDDEAVDEDDDSGKPGPKKKDNKNKNK